MGWKVTHLEAPGIVEIKLSGVVSGDGLREATTEVIDLAHALRGGAANIGFVTDPLDTYPVPE